MAKEDKNKSAIDPVYSHVRVNRPFAFSLFVLCSGVFIFLAGSIYTSVLQNQHWSVIAITSCIICSILLAFPPVEDWVYAPWQKQPQKVEQHHND